MLNIIKISFSFASSSFNSSKNYYQILNIQQNATPNAIKSSFKTLAKKYHPDLNKGNQQKFKEINEAYQVLSDQKIKRQYDESRKGSSQFYNPYQSSTYQQNTSHNEYNPRSQQNRSQQNFWYNNQNQQFYQNHRNYSHYHNNFRRNQYLHELYRQQSEFINRKNQSRQRQRFSRQNQDAYRSAFDEQQMRMLKEEFIRRREYERMRREAQMQEEQQLRRQQEQLERQKAKIKDSMKIVGKALKEEIVDLGKAAWNILKDWKGKK